MNTNTATHDGMHNPDINRRPDVNNPNTQYADSGFNGASNPAAPMHQQPGMNSQHNPAYGSPDTGTMHEPGMNIAVSGPQSVPQHEGYSPSSGSGANDMVSPIGTHSSGEPAAMHQQPGMHHGPGTAHSAGTAHMPGNDPALGAQQPHAHGVPHAGGTDHYDTEKQTVNTSRATGGGERLGNKIKSAAAQGHGLGEMLRGNFNAAVDTIAGDTRARDKNEAVAQAGEDKINRAQAASQAKKEGQVHH